MPEHLEAIQIAVDADLERWALEHQEEYIPKAHAARIQKCVAAGQEAALNNQREVVVLKQFPSVCCLCIHICIFIH